MWNRYATSLTKPLSCPKREDVTALRCCFSKIIPSFFTIKEGSSKIIPSFFTIKEGSSKIIPSFFTIKEGSTSHLGLLPSGKKRKTALRCSEPLRSKVGGASKPSPWLCGMGPLGCYGDQLAIILLKVSAWRGYPPLLP